MKRPYLPDEHKDLTTGVHGVGADYVAKSKSSALFALNAYAGADWKDRTYAGYEVVDTATTYTVGSGGDFASLYAASLAIRNLILTEHVTLQMLGNLTETEAIVFQGLVSIGGELRIDPTTDSHTLTLAGVTNSLTFRGPVVVRMGLGSATNKGTIKAAGNSSWFIYVTSQAYLMLAFQTIDADSKTITRLIYCSDNARVRAQTTTYSNTANVTDICRVAFGGATVTADTDPPSYTVGSGGLAIKVDGKILTSGGTLTPT